MGWGVSIILKQQQDLPWKRRGKALIASVCLLALAACSSGGGGGVGNTHHPNRAEHADNTHNTHGFDRRRAAPALVTMNIANPPSNNFMGNPAPNGTTFNLIQSSMDTTSTTATGHSLSSASLTLANLGVYRLDIPDLNVHQGGLSGLNNAGTLPDGRTYTYAGLALTYSLYAGWAVGSSGTANFGFGVTGFQTPISGLPSGSATLPVLEQQAAPEQSFSRLPAPAPSPSAKCRVMPASM